ncbi:hypothetical protein BACPLE_03728 [Phocaeicola plebeius DSM 17135]|uniref:Uncharacterized protein n=1 Tax=Phocaeicola plebeius (strain DSM 17135 / JCM 12973 / CCUG 54634 / M2) TaxID=484018 RepID=B5D3X4_PHOPM|nr:hypothetical protein BACPLE_03728 [Phocaeicola plebeius DSM 17135]
MFNYFPYIVSNKAYASTNQVAILILPYTKKGEKTSQPFHPAH